MKLIVFSTPDKFHSEIGPVISMFKEGLEYFHLRKPKFSSKDLQEYIELIPEKYHRKIILHTHHKLAKKFKLKGIHITKTHRQKKYTSNYRITLLKIKHPSWTISRSCHRVHTLTEITSKYTYVFLSPVYDSISSSSHGGQFSERSIQKTINEVNIDVIAMGGVDETKFEQLKTLGFNGVVLLGAIWNSNKNPLDVFISAQEKLLEIE